MDLCAAAEAAVGFRPSTPLDEGIRRYVAWYRAYYGEPPVQGSGGDAR